MPPHYRMIVAFLIMATLLLVRQGLFGTRWVTR